MAAMGDWKKVTEDQVGQWQRKQHGVKRWIEEILGMELESEDLAGPLQTGVVLCHVIRRLDERGTLPVCLVRHLYFPFIVFLHRLDN
jgi:hypothetical protein